VRGGSPVAPAVAGHVRSRASRGDADWILRAGLGEQVRHAAVESHGLLDAKREVIDMQGVGGGKPVRVAALHESLRPGRARLSRRGLYRGVSTSGDRCLHTAGQLSKTFAASMKLLRTSPAFPAYRDSQTSKSPLTKWVFVVRSREMGRCNQPIGRALSVSCPAVWRPSIARLSIPLCTSPVLIPRSPWSEDFMQTQRPSPVCHPKRPACL